MEEMRFDCMIFVGDTRVLTCKNCNNARLEEVIEDLRVPYPDEEFEVVRAYKLDQFYVQH